MPELRELYQELIVDHSKNPHNFRRLEDANRSAEGLNPLCGDQVTVYLKLENELIKDISFLGSGCAISKASASIMTVCLKGKTVSDAKHLYEKFHQMVTGQENTKPDFSGLEKLVAFSGVKDFPMRVKCATLAWHALLAALESKKETVSTE